MRLNLHKINNGKKHQERLWCPLSLQYKDRLLLTNWSLTPLVISLVPRNSYYYKTSFFTFTPHGHPKRVKHFASLNTLPRITSNKNLGVLASLQKGVDRKGQVGVNRSALSAYGTLRRMSSFPWLNKMAQMRPCMSTALCLIVFCPPNPAIARPLLHWLHERVSLEQANENRGQGT